MTPILFDAAETNFTSFGIGALVDAASCQVTMRDDTMYDLEMTYPMTGSHFADIRENRIIFAKPCQTDDPQPFRIYRMSKPIGGTVTVYAHHISYDLSGIPVLPFDASSPSDYAAKIKANAAVACPFTFSTDLTTAGDASIEYPASARSLLSGDGGSWQSVYGGELLFDVYSVRLLSSAGANRGVVVRYGVDLVDAKMEESIANTYTGILPYYWDQQTGTQIVGSVLPAAGTFDKTRIKIVDVTDYILADDATKAKVEEVGQTWLEENLIGLPEVSLSLSYAQIDQIVRLYDTITVKMERLGIDLTAKITSTVYDVLKERYITIDVGDVRQTFAVDLYDASRLKTGLLDLKRIKDRSIGGGKMSSGAVGSRVLADWAVIREKIADGAVGGDQIEDGSIGMDKCNASIAGYFNGTRTFPYINVASRGLRIAERPVIVNNSGLLAIENWE